MQKIEIRKIEDKDDYQSSEAYKRLRTNLQLCGAERKVIVISSCLPSEGKSTTTVNLCISLAEMGQRVLLVDADLRKSVMVGRYHITRMTRGLSHYLAGQAEAEQIFCETNIPGLDMIDHIGKVQIIDLAAAIVAAPPGAVQPAAEVDHRRVGVSFQIVPDFPRQIVLPHGDLQRAEALHQTAGVLISIRKVIVDFVNQAHRRFILVEIRIQL